MADLSLKLLGGFEVRRASMPAIAFRTRKAKALLAYLAWPPGQGHARDKLAAVLWGNSDQDYARRYLRNTLALLRKSVSDKTAQIIVSDGDRLYLDPETVEVDAVAFDRLVSRGTPVALEQAMAIYQGGFLDGFELKEDTFLEWVASERASLHEKALAALTRLLDHYLATGEIEPGIQVALRLLSDDPLQESVHGALIRLYLQQERYGAALRQYESCREVLERELGIVPGPEIERLHQEIRSNRRRSGQGAGRDPSLGDGAAPEAESAARLHLSENPTIAVLPFEYLSGEPAQSHFAAAITYDLVSALLRHRWLSVISAANMLSTGRYSMITDGNVVESNVDYLLTGGIRTAADRVRISVQLVETNSGEHIWSNNYDRQFDDIFQVQDEITGTIAAHVEPEIGARERYRVLRKPAQIMGAWDCFHLGMAHFYNFTNQDSIEAQRLYSRSLELDPDFGESHAWWSLSKLWSTFYFDAEASEPVLEEVLRAAKRAIAIDDQNAIFHFILARAYLARREYAEGLAEMEIAIDLNPNQSAIYCGLGDALTYEARYEEAFEQFEKALRLGPREPFRSTYLGYGALAYLFAEEFETAVDWAENAIRLPRSHYWASAHRAVALGHLRRREDAQAAVADLLRQQPGFTRNFATRKLYFIKRPEQLQLYLDGLRKAGVPE